MTTKRSLKEIMQENVKDSLVGVMLMATHSSTLAWKLPWTEEPGRLQSMASLRVGHGNPLQCSCLENPRDRGAWWAAVYGIAQSQTGPGLGSFSRADRGIGGVRPVAPPTWLAGRSLCLTKSSACGRLWQFAKVKVKSLSHVRLFATPWTVAHYAPLSMLFSRQEYWSGLPFIGWGQKISGSWER